ncbi:MAG TPA: class I SAM-dependent methyltransferase [Thermomicrobiales bacterium]|jgi:SAM-dependent methyltransferase|nr:class I SAM-dependent methyltransferase [Thermomicrobiales bacterium]
MTAARRFDDGSAGDVDYGLIGRDYARYRQPEPAIAARIVAALGDARTVLNVGAGAGSYEPTDRDVTAVEPSATMRAQRPPHLPAAIDAVAERLPFPDESFDAAMATYTVHQWDDLAAGIGELRRVTHGPIVILAADPACLHDFWLTHYLTEALDRELTRFPAIDRIASLLGPGTMVTPVPIPLHCTDGFTEAYYGRPERLLDPGVQRAMSSWTQLEPEVLARFDQGLRADLASGAWDQRFGHLRTEPEYVGSLRLIVRPDTRRPG